MRKSLIMGTKADVQKMKEKRERMTAPYKGEVVNVDQRRIVTFNHPILGNN